MTRYCLGCYTKLVIDPVTVAVVHHQKEQPLPAEFLRMEPWPGVLQCSQCQAEVNAFFKRGQEIFAACGDCERLLRAEAKPQSVPAGLSRDP